MLASEIPILIPYGNRSINVADVGFFSQGVIDCGGEIMNERASGSKIKETVPGDCSETT